MRALYEQALHDEEVRRARVHLNNALVVYFQTVHENLEAQDVMNLVHQAADVVDELLAGYPQVKAAV